MQRRLPGIEGSYGRTLLKEDQLWDIHNAVTSSQFRAMVQVHLEDSQFVCQISPKHLQSALQEATPSTPGGVEVHQDWLRR